MENLNNNDQLNNTQDELVLSELAQQTDEILDQIEKHQPELDKLIDEAKWDFVLANEKQLSNIEKSAEKYNEKHLSKEELKKYNDILNSYIKWDSSLIDKVIKYQTEKWLEPDWKIWPNTKKALDNTLPETKIPDRVEIADINSNNDATTDQAKVEKLDKKFTVDSVVWKEFLEWTRLRLRQRWDEVLLWWNVNDYIFIVNGNEQRLRWELIFTKNLRINSDLDWNLQLISWNDIIEMLNKHNNNWYIESDYMPNNRYTNPRMQNRNDYYNDWNFNSDNRRWRFNNFQDDYSNHRTRRNHMHGRWFNNFWI